MTQSETLTFFLAPFIQQLYRSGVRDVVISPGSRSTPLTVLFKEHPGIQVWMNVDERSAGFFALGMAKGKRAPIALVCSSGTAAANFFPAIIEAKYSEVPLIVLTADRPHELREVGAPQAIDQSKIYGTHVKDSVDLPLPEQEKGIKRFMSEQAAHAVRMATAAPMGPVHLNFPFREPLMPEVKDISWDTFPNEITNHETVHVLSDAAIQGLRQKLGGLKRPLIVVGPEQKNLGEALHQLAEHLQAPILADPLSQLRAGDHPKKWVIDGYDAFLRVQDFTKTYRADGIIRFGPIPVSKPLLKYTDSLSLDVHAVVNEGGRRSDPTHQMTEWVNAEPLTFIQSLTNALAETGQESQGETEWAKVWLKANAVTKDVTSKYVEKTPWFEGHVVTEMLKALPEKATVFASNSMPIRDLDSFFLTTTQNIRTMGNRGTNGIDGINSTALGISTQSDPTFLIIGDLSFFHDTNGLMVGKQYGLDLTCLVVNNNGGGIFSFLPQAQSAEHFEELFGTPLAWDISDVANLYKVPVFKATNREELNEALKQAGTKKGLKLIECVTSRPENVALHQAYWKEVQVHLLHALKEVYS